MSLDYPLVAKVLCAKPDHDHQSDFGHGADSLPDPRVIQVWYPIIPLYVLRFSIPVFVRALLLPDKLAVSDIVPVRTPAIAKPTNLITLQCP